MAVARIRDQPGHHQKIAGMKMIDALLPRPTGPLLSTGIVQQRLPCGACSFCADICGAPSCVHCQNKQQQFHASESSFSSSLPDSCLPSPCCRHGHNDENQRHYQNQQHQTKYYTMCQIKRHNTEKSAWLIIGNNVYDVTSIIPKHPGGKTCLIKRSGGQQDCTQDYQFHSKKGRQRWQKCYIGKIRKCPSESHPRPDNESYFSSFLSQRSLSHHSMGEDWHDHSINSQQLQHDNNHRQWWMLWR